MKKVFVLISDENYLSHAKSLFYNVKENGEWDGDLCLIANNLENYDLSDFEEFGVHILHRKSENKFKINLFIFDFYFTQWDYLVYMDCDFMVFKNINKFLKKYDLNFKGLLIDKEPFKIKDYFCQGWDYLEKSKEIEKLNKKYNVNKFGFNAGYISFNTSIIKTNTLNDLKLLDDEVKDINNHLIPTGTDQAIFNLYFQNVQYIKNSDICFCDLLTDETTASHFCGGGKPWDREEYSKFFGKTYKEKYIENLKNFNASIYNI